MEQKKLLGMPTNVAFGLTWLCFIFGIVLLAIEHEKMEREEKLEVVSCFVLVGFDIIISVVIAILGAILSLVELQVIANVISIVVSLAFFALFIVKMILAFMGKEWKVPVAYSMAEKFVK